MIFAFTTKAAETIIERPSPFLLFCYSHLFLEFSLIETDYDFISKVCDRNAELSAFSNHFVLRFHICGNVLFFVLHVVLYEECFCHSAVCARWGCVDYWFCHFAIFSTSPDISRIVSCFDAAGTEIPKMFATSLTQTFSFSSRILKICNRPGSPSASKTIDNNLSSPADSLCSFST